MNLHAPRSLEQDAICKEHINQLPLLDFTGNIELITTEEQCHEALPALQQCPVLGFDTETRPTFRKGQFFLPSLIQLATHNHVYLFQISRFNLPAGLLEIFSSQHIVKVGAGLNYDVKQLQQIAAFDEQSFVDIAHLATRLGIKQTGLRTLCALLFGKRLSKKARCSDWSRKHLSAEQIKYAAADAWISRELYMALNSLLEKQNASAEPMVSGK